MVDSQTLLPPSWGLLGPDGVGSVRRVRSLDVGSAVRQFNDAAVPGMGGVWAGRQLLWPLLGIAAGQSAGLTARVSNIEAANAIEALACRMALDANGWQRDPRIRGAQKLRGATDFTFKAMSRPGYYVSQPMRMFTVQPLRALGFVAADSERFNAYRLSESGQDFIEAACAPFPNCWYSHDVLNTLTGWLSGNPRKVIDRKVLGKAITPLSGLPSQALQVLRERLVGRWDPASKRRRDALAWVKRVRQDNVPIDPMDAAVPIELTPEHWMDLRVGARFFRAREAAIDVLHACERAMGPAAAPLSLARQFPASVRDALASARIAAEAFLTLAEGNAYDPSGVQFCRELVSGREVDALRCLVARDGRVLRLSGSDIVDGMAFIGVVEQESDGEPSEGEVTVADGLLPPHLSGRLRNMMLLDLDMAHQLSAWLADRSGQ